MILAITGFGVEYATRLSVTSVALALAATAATSAATAVKAVRNRRMRLLLFFRLSTEVVNKYMSDPHSSNKQSRSFSQRLTELHLLSEHGRHEQAGLRSVGGIPSLARGGHAPAQRRPAKCARPDAERLRGDGPPRACRGPDDAPGRPGPEHRPDCVRDHPAPRRARVQRLRREGRQRVRRARLVREADRRGQQEARRGKRDAPLRDRRALHEPLLAVRAFVSCRAARTPADDRQGVHGLARLPLGSAHARLLEAALPDTRDARARLGKTLARA